MFAGALWDAPLWTNRQHIAVRLAARGWRVLTVEPRFFLPRLLLGKFPGTAGKWRWLRRHLVPWEAAPNLWVVAQSNRFPGSRRSPWVGRLNHVLFNAWNVRWHARHLGVRDPVLLLYDTEAAEFLNDFPASRVVYDCVDDHVAEAEAHGGNPALVRREEGAIVARAEAIAVTTEPLWRRFSPLHRTVALVPNAAEVGAFLRPAPPEPPDIARIPRPRIGIVGALDAYKLDVPLLAEVMRAYPAWQFVFVGPAGEVGSRERAGSVSDLQQFPNAHFLGPKPRHEVPAVVHAFDVAMIPYRESSYNRSSFPLKFWEFLAAGKPVVASGLPSLEPYRHLVSLVHTPGEFAAALENALAVPERGRDARVVEAQRHDWEQRVDAVERLLRA